MKNLPLFFLFTLLFVACADKKESINESFYGIIPCADCPGIEYELHLNNDNTFAESMRYLDRNVDAFEHDGTYTIEQDSIIILDRGEEQEGFKKLALKDDILVILDTEGNEVEGELAAHYILSKEKPEISDTEYSVEYSFKAQGNEPFWNVRFGTDNTMYLSALMEQGELRYSFPTPEAKELNEHAKSYRVENEELEMELIVFTELCNDTMADISFTHKVSVQLKLAAWDAFQDLQGCGEYEGIYQLNNIWMLSAINGEEIEESNRTAHLQFEIGEGIFYGNGGCNNIGGQVEHTETTVTLSKIASTQMACENLEEEDKFLSKLQETTYNIQLSKNDLTLSNEENELVFKRLD